jgi:hypothetical protein
MSHHQSPVHISPKTLFLRALDVQCRSGAYRMCDLNRGLPISSRITSIISRIYTTTTRESSPSFTLIVTALQAGPGGRVSISFIIAPTFDQTLRPRYCTKTCE